MASNRIYYAIQRATLCPCDAAGSNDLTKTTAGFVSNLVQSVGVSTSLEYEQVFELGRLQIFENVEGIPSVEITLERAIGVYGGSDSTTLDGFTSDGTLWDLCGNSVSTASERRFNLNMETADDSFTSQGHVQATGLYLSNYSLNFAVDGPATESVTLVGNTCDWDSGVMPTKGSFESDILSSTASPAANSGVIARKHVTSGSVGITKLQSVSFSISFDREDLNQLGDKYPYFKAAGFPVETSLELEYIATKDSGFRDFNENSDCDLNFTGGGNIKAGNRTFNFGTMDWTGTSRSGGDAGGGNATITFSFQGFNFFTVGTNTEYTTANSTC